VADELHRAIASAVGRRRNEALAELVFRWSGAPPMRADGYRDAPPGSAQQALREGLLDYLSALGEREIAEALAHAEVVRIGAPPCEVRVSTANLETARSHRARSILTRAVRDLLGDDGASVSLRQRA
jgi:hypothetical protein